MKFAQKLGIEGAKGALQKMRALPAQELSEAGYKYMMEDSTGTGFTGSWQINHLTIDGYVLHDSPANTFLKGKQNNVPLITGTTADEGTLFQLFLFRGPNDAGKYRHFVDKAFGKAGDKVLQMYGAADNDVAGQSACSVLGSAFFCGARRVARSMSAVQPNTYRYLFSMPPKFFIYMLPGIPNWKEIFRCYHAAEIPYVFHFMALPGLEDDDRLLADQIAAYWARFARTGNPNGDGTPLWPAYTRKEENYLVLDNPIKTGSGYQDKACDFVEEMETARY